MSIIYSSNGIDLVHVHLPIFQVSRGEVVTIAWRSSDSGFWDDIALFRDALEQRVRNTQFDIYSSFSCIYEVPFMGNGYSLFETYVRKGKSASEIECICQRFGLHPHIPTRRLGSRERLIGMLEEASLNHGGIMYAPHGLDPLGVSTVMEYVRCQMPNVAIIEVLPPSLSAEYAPKYALYVERNIDA